jgi:hypothetical protein
MNEKDLRDVFAMLILNGMLSRIPPEEIDPDNVWYLADAMVETREPKSVSGLPPIKRRRKSEA